MLKPSLLRIVLRLMRTHRLQAPLLTLGVQDVLLTYDEATAMLRAEGMNPIEVPPEQRLTTTSYLAGEQAPERRWTHARTFFRCCGIDEYDDLDASVVEGPALVHDLNEPVPQLWHGRYNWILDSGTIEHVFDIRSSLSNVARMTAVGGHVMHISPMTGWANHGFYQLSPCLFYDFYSANGFEPVTSLIAHPLTGPQRGLSVAQYNYSPERLQMKGGEPVLLVFLARKVAEVPQIRLPIQSKYMPRMQPAHRLAG